MKKQNEDHIKVAHSGAGSVGLAVAILCAGTMLPSLAQTGNGTAKALAAGERNLQVQQGAAVQFNNNQRIALVIGNAAYKDAPLTNPVNDARAIVLALKESGFSVIARENIDQRGMLAVLREFGDRLRGGGTGLFYYAGHGMQIKGRNYLIPVGANIDREDEVAYSAVDAQAVLDKMEAAGNVANIMILDACRNNPFTRSMRSGQAGLAQMDAPVGTLLAYATSPGAVASDGNGTNGLYTQHLLTAIRQPGNKVEDVFKQVRANVRRDSQGKQVPWESTSLEGDFYFRGAPVAAPQVDPAQEAEAALWNAVKDSTQAIELRVYLNRYPVGKFAGVASTRLEQLQRAATEQANAEANRKAAAERATAEVSQRVAAERARVQADEKTAVERAVAEAKQNEATQRLAAEAQKKEAAEREIAQANERAAIQAAVDKRTEELVASLATSAAASTATRPALSKPVHPGADSNSVGFTVGDRWRYQVVDKWKGEVVRNINFQVTKILANGDMEWNDGNLLMSPIGSRRHSSSDVTDVFDYTPELEWLPTELRIGYKQGIKFTVTRRRDGFEITEQHRGTLIVKVKEKVRVPAGEFDAYRIERDTEFSGMKSSGSERWYGNWVAVFWYVPELRNYVAYDQEYRTNGRLLTRERQELTSFSVHGTENLAQR
jgi:uncharacterized caspase-like protein